MDSQAIQFGMMNSMRTNNVLLDTLICLLIPVFFKCLYDSTTHLAPLLHYFQGLYRKKTDQVLRRIEIKQHFNSYGKVHDGDQHNHILQKAISIYLSQHLDMDNQSGRYELLEKLDKTKSDDDDNNNY
ncbi:hypothetical protein As57867_004245, partial [Aphanomyces stellatus]